MKTEPTTGIIKKIFPAQHLTAVSIQRFLFVEPETEYAQRQTHRIQAINGGINLLDGIAEGDKVEITCYANGKEKAGVDFTKYYTCLRLKSLKKTDLYV